MNLKIKTHIYADGADLIKIKKFNKFSWIKGFTTNPSLIKKSGYSNYMQYARQVLNVVKKKPVSLEAESPKNVVVSTCDSALSLNLCVEVFVTSKIN